MVTSTCNTVELAAPSDSRYVPDIAGASAADRAQARKLLVGVNEFCDTHSASALAEQWRPGLANPSNPTHFFNPSPSSRGLDPENPRAALIYNGALGGVMFTGRSLPSVGNIPRLHSHGSAQSMDMLHVYCTGGLREAFTPNRVLGVKADVMALRQMLRPEVQTLDAERLHTVLAFVRQHAAGLNPPAVFQRPIDGPNPERQAKRMEIRTSLMALDEPKLRAVHALIRS